MATQSLYRRFRPRKFSELYGQEHVVRALRNAVIHHREGQAYLFSGPRGTGKTSTARILAKVLNCANPVDGEPCCECESCLAVDNGISYDVLELDAASNNGVQEIRDIIDAAALASPGRHRVFILDEVHMLTRGAEAALLKTLEEPPDQVVFVLATTDPQKISETIRSRVQHLQFHLLPQAELEKYVRHVVAEAHLDVTDDAIEQVLRQGGGSARDTLSALELVAAGGGESIDLSHADDLVRAMIDRDHAAALGAVARAIQDGRDARTFSEDVVRTLRDCFLSQMSPDLVQASSTRMGELDALGRGLGPQRTVHAMETLGKTLIEMRHAPDARLLLEVAVVQLSSPIFDDSMENLLVRIKQLEESVRELREKGVAAAMPPAPINPASGKAKVGGLAGQSATRDITAPTPQPAATVPTETTSSQPHTASPEPVVANTSPSKTAAPKTAPQQTPTSDEPAAPASTAGDPAQLWPQITDSLSGLAKPLFKPASVASVSGNVVTVRLPGNTPVRRAEQNSKALIAAIDKMCGGSWRVMFEQGDATGGMSRPDLDDALSDAAPADSSGSVARTIVDEVREDPFAPLDESELVSADAAIDPTLETLMEHFPQGRVEEIAQDDDVPSGTTTRAKKK